MPWADPCLPTVCAHPTTTRSSACLQSRALLLTLPTAVQLVLRVEAAEAAAAEALCVPAEAGGELADSSKAEDVEEGVGVEENGGGPSTPPCPQQASLLHRVRSSPYTKSVASVLAMLGSLVAWLAIFKGVAAACRGLPAALSSKAGLSSGAPCCGEPCSCMQPAVVVSALAHLC